MLQILLQKTYISQIYYANDKSLFPQPAITLRNSLEICECRRVSGAPPSQFGRDSRYAITLSEVVARGQPRPLHDPDSE